MKNPISMIGIDMHSNGAVWVSVGRRASTDSQFKNYCLLSSDSKGHKQRFLQRAQRAQAALLARGER
jgi:hypothetical protein